MKNKKPEIITFKVDESLSAAIKAVPNRSEFIRAAVLAALDSVCPLCRGTGVMTPNQRRHWKTLAEDHAVQECGECHEMMLVCAKKKRNIHAKNRRGHHG